LGPAIFEDPLIKKITPAFSHAEMTPNDTYIKELNDHQDEPKEPFLYVLLSRVCSISAEKKCDGN
jgi:hypothetical protein